MIDESVQWSCRASQDYPINRKIDTDFMKNEDVIALKHAIDNYDTKADEIIDLFKTISQ